MICENQPTERTLTQLPLADSEVLKPHLENQSPPKQTESSEGVPKRTHRPKAKTEEERQQRRREDYLRHYYKNQQKGQQYSKKYQAEMRAKRKLVETPEEIAARNAYNREQYHKNKEQRQAWRNSYNAENKDRDRESSNLYRRSWRRDQFVNNHAFKIACTLRSRVREAFKSARLNKETPSLELVGCSATELVKYIEANWQSGMTWENIGIGNGKWVLDHIKPCAAFDLTDPEQQRVCFNFRNLKPIWWMENAKKGSMWNGRRWKHSDHALLAKADD